jgi:hypothetical protein
MATAELVILSAPFVLLFFCFFTVAAEPQYGVTEEGLRYKKIDSPTRAFLVGKRGFWILFSPPGSREDGRFVVSWPAGWAYVFGSALVLFASLAPAILPPNRHSSPVLYAAILTSAVVGYALFFLSPILSSLAATALAIGCIVLYFYSSRRAA